MRERERRSLVTFLLFPLIIQVVILVSDSQVFTDTEKTLLVFMILESAVNVSKRDRGSTQI